MLALMIFPTLGISSEPFHEQVQRINDSNKCQHYQDQFDRRYREQHANEKPDPWNSVPIEEDS